MLARHCRSPTTSSQGLVRLPALPVDGLGNDEFRAVEAHVTYEQDDEEHRTVWKSVAWMGRPGTPLRRTLRSVHARHRLLPGRPYAECGNLPDELLPVAAALGREEAEEESEKVLRIHAFNEICGG
jgi:hypothetical protein